MEKVRHADQKTTAVAEKLHKCVVKVTLSSLSKVQHGTWGDDLGYENFSPFFYD